ncbi:MAG: hypothetical protein ACE37I_05440 [Rubinisphaera brasiliensis]|uniref:Uncharacterized protein n=1 Tax=Rubinisphaera brasiliensis (strain ATCC 49424 / DSM 5305 / JCM 21570 / IAM 15109 / NBRC 103401 / IFAM 1448) TaxID=756272 RepID=F0SGV7_RUBBR|nr:hypothetical protein [Rubinisphaera brasiliensis]ADY58392.1 hypothetical protein Plabr_0768 [Rubinisphaera brasiliensis DSM 5305]
MNLVNVFETTSAEGDAIMLAGDRDAPFAEFANWLESEATRFERTNLADCPHVAIEPALSLLLNLPERQSLLRLQPRPGLHREHAGNPGRYTWTMTIEDWFEIAETIRELAATALSGHIYLPDHAADDRVIVVSRGEFKTRKAGRRTG